MKNLSLRVKLIFYTALISAVSILSVAVVSSLKTKKTLTSLATDQLLSTSKLMKDQIQSYLSDSSIFTKRLAKDRLIEGLFIAYEGAFYGEAFESGKDQNILSDSYRFNDQIYGDRTRQLANDFSFSNIMLASIQGQILMTSSLDLKGHFLGRSLTGGILKESALAQCFAKAMQADSKGPVFSDFKFYTTSQKVHSFLCQKAYAEFNHEDDGIQKGDTLGVVISEIDLDRLNTITQQRVGMGQTGQVYLIGADHYLRSNHSINEEKFNIINSHKNNLLLEGKFINQALEGSQGIINRMGPNENLVLTAYSPLNVYGTPWAFFAEKNIDEIYAPVNSTLLFMAILSSGLFLIVVIIGNFSSKKITRPVANANQELTAISSSVSSHSKNVKDYSTSLNRLSGDLSSSIHETVSTMDELTQMVNKNLDCVDQSSQKSTHSQNAVDKGIEKVQLMLQSIHDISTANSEVTKTVNGLNEEMVEIINVINDIVSKTSVINDIVFQTKLLSFNASVEAARAGEHGKGFTVVAEEVGNLATESGKAAKEISDMLNQSVSRVENIIKNSQVKMENISLAGQEKVETGLQVAQDCQKTLEEIVQNVAIVNNLIQEVKLASNEQAHGISEVSKAMQLLDQVCNDTQNISQNILAVSEQLQGGSNSLYQVVDDLTILVEGKGRSKTHRPIQQRNVKKLELVSSHETKETKINTAKEKSA
jgi:methyl-accepting chemotaxis protein